MGFDLRIAESKFYSEIKNGDDFSLNTSDFSQHLKGSIMERIKAEFRVRVGNYYQIRGQADDTWRIDNTLGDMTDSRV